MRKYLIILLALFCLVGYSQQKQLESLYIRYQTEQGTDKKDEILQTAISTLQKGDTRIDLVSIAHLADTPYYTKIKTHLEQYQVVLYELVG
ncbi:MAG: hypothetical protein AAF226_11170, partial [Verrucomicrobiota bacterium]